MKMGVVKTSFEESLYKDVISKGRCTSCSACVIVCPYKCLEYHKGEPVLKTDCKICGICAQVCPRYGSSQSEVEKFVFGRESAESEPFGIYRRIVAARATDERILKVCQDGGIVTTLLIHALTSGSIDGAVVSGLSQTRPLFPASQVVTTSEGVLDCAGTRYFCSPNLFAVPEALKNHAKIAFVGTPCQVLALRKLQMLNMKRYAASMEFVIGLMCSESFSYEGLMEKYIHEKLGCNLSDIKNMNIKGKMLITMKNGLVQEIPLSEVRQFARGNCRVCGDFSSTLADISVGGLGLTGWTLTVIRTEKGDQLFSEAEQARLIETKSLAKEENPIKLLTKLSQLKKQRSTQI